MCRVRLTGAALMVVLFAAGAGRSGPGDEPEEPTYKGKTLRQWMARMGDSDKGYDHRVIRAIGEMGPDAKAAVPALVEALQNNDAYFSALYALGDIGPDAKDAVPLLIDRLGKGYPIDTEPVALTLGMIGEPAIPALLRVLKGEDRKKRYSSPRQSIEPAFVQQKQ